ncbi:MAG: hypothetical protein K2R98_12845 [Gemmataceae bacterium]|nr:hypothetical protein [Gemmataceae bacterium]
MSRLDGTAELPSPRRVTMPCWWRQGGLQDFAGRVRLLRRFGFPGRLDAHDRVWLTFAGAAERAEVWLNDEFLGRHEGAGPFEFEITRLLRVRNLLRVEVDGSADGGLWGEIALEVRCTAFLRGVRFAADVRESVAHVRASGEVVGSAEGLLELYLLLDRRTVGYVVVTASEAGQAFSLTSEELEPDCWRTGADHLLRLDLVKGASVWYQSEQPFDFSAGPS